MARLFGWGRKGLYVQLLFSIPPPPSLGSLSVSAVSSEVYRRRVGVALRACAILVVDMSLKLPCTEKDYPAATVLPCMNTSKLVRPLPLRLPCPSPRERIATQQRARAYCHTHTRRLPHVMFQTGLPCFLPVSLLNDNAAYNAHVSAGGLGTWLANRSGIFFLRRKMSVDS